MIASFLLIQSSEWTPIELPANKTQRNVYTVKYEIEDTKAPEYEAKLKSRNSFGWSDYSEKYPFAAGKSQTQPNVLQFLFLYFEQ